MRERAPQNQKAKIPRSCFLKAWARGGSSSVVYLDFLKIDHDYLGALQVRCSDPPECSSDPTFLPSRGDELLADAGVPNQGHCLSNLYEQIVMFRKKRGNVADL